jgi:hypothetical protein
MNNNGVRAVLRITGMVMLFCPAGQTEPSAARATVLLGHSLHSFPRKTSAVFYPPCKCCAFAYPDWQNVVNSRSDRRHFLKFVVQKVLTKTKL